MNGLARYALFALLSAAIGVGLSQLPRFDAEGRSRAVSVPADAGREVLTSDNLVDRLEELPFYLNVKHVTWETSMLTVDFSAPAAVDVAAAYTDVYKLMKWGLTDTVNVQEVRVRIYAKSVEPGAQPPLLVAADARREDGIRFTDRQRESADQVKRFLESRCRLTVTQRWKSMLAR
ncbi:hypothetical protein [Gorillibacterium sp. sgz500922]|uniref:hypothetical protein n=1 Tax=Gorillibacterium sp. sgz500922 TaxID=3446694 RepID=UPI003F66D181